MQGGRRNRASGIFANYWQDVNHLIGKIRAVIVLQGNAPAWMNFVLVTALNTAVLFLDGLPESVFEL